MGRRTFTPFGMAEWVGTAVKAQQFLEKEHEILARECYTVLNSNTILMH